MGEIIHGKSGSYTNHKCRCDECKEAWRKQVAKRKAERFAEPTPDHVHGTRNGYGNYGCRCPECTAAWTEHSRDQNRRHREQGDLSANVGKANLGNGKLSVEDCRSIRNRHADNERVSTLAQEFGVTVGAIYLVLNRGIANANVG